jgi:hypothetical protein
VIADEIAVMNAVILDDFTGVSGWDIVTSGTEQVKTSQDRGPHGVDGALRLEFDFRGGGGFIVVRKRFWLSLADDYVFTLEIRGTAPSNKLEFKLVDPSGRNVWLYRKDAFELPAQWQSLRIHSSQIAFGWGPAGGGPVRDVGAIEFAIVAPPGGKGTVCIANLRMEDHSYRAIPVVEASSARPGHDPQCVLDGISTRSWQSAPSDDPQWLRIDFGQPRDYGGLILHWDPATRARPFDIEHSNDGVSWHTVYSAEQPGGPRSYVYLPPTTSQQLRICLHRGDDGDGVGIAEIEVRSREFSRSLNAFFRHVADEEARGSFPRYLCGEQTYWTTVGNARNESLHALLSEDGMVEVDQGAFSIEPFLYIDEALITWAAVSSAAQELEQGFLPIPSSVWRTDGITLRVSAFAVDRDGKSWLYIRYRIENRRGQRTRVRLFAAVRPFQVTPPWQAHEEFGGVSPITLLEYRDRVVSVNRLKLIAPLTVPNAFGAISFDRGPLIDYLRSGDVPSESVASDHSGRASGALRFDLDLQAGSTDDLYLAIADAAPDGSRISSPRVVDATLDLNDAVRNWISKLDRVELRLPVSAAAFTDTFKTAVAHILVNRAGSALQAGPRRYARSWIRDGATMAAALLRAGCHAEVRDYVQWYAGHQAPDGTIPCCVDRNGPDWLEEYDSQGEFIYAVMEYFRFTADRQLLSEMWPAIAKSVDRIVALRSQRLTSEFQAGEKRACYGLLPESVSHEGYMAHPVHSYWDDFWTLRGLKDAASMAHLLADEPQHQRLVALRDSFRETLHASIVTTITDRKLDYIPASVELADIDPAATANAIALLCESQALPSAALAHTFDEYLAHLRKRRSGEIDWTNYSPYEIRIIGALVRLGKREAACELAHYFLADRRPMGWNQWSEIAWRDRQSPANIGDMPHTWIAAEFVLAFRAMLAFERELDDALVIAAGVPAEWLANEDGISIRGLPTWYGTLDFTMYRARDALEVDFVLSGNVVMPRGGIVIEPPIELPLRTVMVNGQPAARFTGAHAIVDQSAAKVRLLT